MALALDGSNALVGTFNGGTTITLTTSNSNDIIVVAIGANAQGSSVTGGGLTFTQRGQANFTSNNWWITYFTAVASSPLSNVGLTANWSNGNQLGSIWTFGVSGANTSTIWDPNASLPAIANTADNVSYSTTNVNNFIITGMTDSNNTPAAPSGFTLIGTNTNFFSGFAYQIVSATQSSVNVNWAQGGNGATIVDAITQFTGSSTIITLNPMICM